MRLTLFKLPSHRVFRHTPIYYNEKSVINKERLIETPTGYEQNSTTNSDYGTRMKGAMRQRKQIEFNLGYKQRKQSNVRLLIIIAALMALALYFLASSKEWLMLLVK